MTLKVLSKLLGNILKWILIILLLLFGLATFMGKGYVQTLVLLFTILLLVWWPDYFANKWNRNTSVFLRVAIIVLLVASNFILFKPAPKSSIYLSESYKSELYEIYDKKVDFWPEDTKDIYIETQYGKVHVLTCGRDTNPPLIMLHAASMGAHSWAENLDPLLDHYRIFAIDNIGEGNRSELKNALNYPDTQEEIAYLYACIADSLGIKSSPVFGASNGGFIAMCYAFNYPERVKSLALFGPMGLTQLTGKSITMLSISTMYPFQFVRNAVTNWALGRNEYIVQKYGDWFNAIMKGTIPSVAKPVPLTARQKNGMDLPVLLFLGTKDAIVGDAEFAKQTAQDFPDVRIEVLESDHLIAVEHADYVNERIKNFLSVN